MDNDKEKFLFELGQIGSIFGDCFVKVAYKEPWVDDIGMEHPGRVLLLPLNPATCFPRWHAHEPGRLEEFKLKYKFWDCVDTKTEALTVDGWKSYDQLNVGDLILSLDPDTDTITWKPVTAVKIHENYPGHMVQWDTRINAVTSPNHRWLAERQKGHGIGGVPGKEHTTDTLRYEREVVRTEFAVDGDSAVTDLRKGSRLVVGGGTPAEFPAERKWSDELVETVGWYVTEGCDHYNQQDCHSIYIGQKKPEHVPTIRRLMAYWKAEGATFNEYKPDKNGVISWYLGKGVKTVLEDAAPSKQITPEFLASLTYHQAKLLHETLVAGDGCRIKGSISVKWTQDDQGRKDGYQMLCAMLGIRTAQGKGNEVQDYQSRYVQTDTIKKKAHRVYDHDGIIWCPVVDGGIWFARRGGSTYWTGNTAPDGTRIMNTYVEIITDHDIKEYVNDQLIRENPNPIGEIPVVHIANQISPGSPWGMSDIAEIIPINREYNEKATDISDIISYHAAPITVVTGGTPPELEKGPSKIWGLKNDKSKVYNLEGGFAGLPHAIEHLQRLKTNMHEMTGVPVTALGQEQPISNTSGVALAIQYFHTMMKYGIKQTTYGHGIKQLTRLVLLHLFIKEPETLAYNPNTDGIMEEGQVPILDMRDHAIYRVDLEWPPPLPVDSLIKLSEIEKKMMLNLESRRGAMRDMGEQFPDEKLEELFLETKEDLVHTAALDIIKSKIQSFIMEAFGVVPEGGGEPVPPTPAAPAGNGSGGGASAPAPQPKPPPGLGNISELVAGMDSGLISEIVTQATLPRVPMQRNIDKSDQGQGN